MHTHFRTISFVMLALACIASAKAQVVDTQVGQTYVTVTGDPGEVGGMCNLVGICISPNRGLPLNYFATTDSVADVQTRLDAFGIQVNSVTNSLSALQTQFSAYSVQTNAFLHQLRLDEDRNASGVAMAFAMAGVADLNQGENVAFTGNWGTFQGRSGLAAGVAVRATDNLSFNGGIAQGLSGGGVGGRLGFRVAW